MTSNLASNEIAEHALDLRKEQRENRLREDLSKKINYFHGLLKSFFILYIIYYLFYIFSII